MFLSLKEWVGKDVWVNTDQIVGMDLRPVEKIETDKGIKLLDSTADEKDIKCWVVDIVTSVARIGWTVPFESKDKAQELIEYITTGRIK